MLVKYNRGITPLTNIFKELEDIERTFFKPLTKDFQNFDITIPIKFIEKPEKYEVIAEIPGVNKEDINIDINDNILTITAIKKEEKEEENDRIHFSYIEYGEFKQSVKLPKNIDLEKVEAEYKNGILRINLPKLESKNDKIKKIVIK